MGNNTVDAKQYLYNCYIANTNSYRIISRISGIFANEKALRAINASVFEQ